MGMETHSTRRNRVYARKFDHDEAFRLHQQGWTYEALARRYDVKPMTVRRVIKRRYGAIGDGATS